MNSADIIITEPLQRLSTIFAQFNKTVSGFTVSVDEPVQDNSTLLEDYKTSLAVATDLIKNLSLDPKAVRMVTLLLDNLTLRVIELATNSMDRDSRRNIIKHCDATIRALDELTGVESHRKQQKQQLEQQRIQEIQNNQDDVDGFAQNIKQALSEIEQEKQHKHELPDCDRNAGTTEDKNEYFHVMKQYESRFGFDSNKKSHKLL
jgi:uncharacterized membrane protein